MTGSQQRPETPEEFAARLRTVVNAPLIPWSRPRRSRIQRQLLRLRGSAARAPIARGIRVERREVTLDNFDPERLASEPCDALVARRALSLIPRDCRDALVEVGCGMGFVACLAAGRDFRHVVGLDIGASLTRRARQDAELERRHPGSAPVDVVSADAALWPIPDEATTAFLFCAFAGRTFAAWLDRVRETLERRPGPFAIAYVYPIEAEQVHASGLFREIARRRGGYLDDPAWRIVVYRHDA